MYGESNGRTQEKRQDRLHRRDFKSLWIGSQRSTYEDFTV
jgi:hypothetical protein